MNNSGNNTSRMAALLGRLRREMNGAVVEAMVRGGIRGLLNYGVSIPTIREIAAQEERDHLFARYLYRQQVRELRLVAMMLADPEQLTAEEAAEWLAGATTWELRDMLASTLLAETGEALMPLMSEWIASSDEVSAYTALHTLARNRVDLSPQLMQSIVSLPERFPENNLIAQMLVRFFTFRFSEFPEIDLPKTPSGCYVTDELRALYG